MALYLSCTPVYFFDKQNNQFYPMMFQWSNTMMQMSENMALNNIELNAGVPAQAVAQAAVAVPLPKTPELNIDPILERELTKASHVAADYQLKKVKATNRLKELASDLDVLESGKLPDGMKPPSVMTEISTMKDPFSQSREEDLLISMVVPRGSSRNDALASLHLQYMTWVRRIQHDGQEAHAKIQDHVASQQEFFNRLDAIKLEESMATRSGLEDAKGIRYSDTDLVIANKREQLWQNALMEAESKLARDAKTKEQKNTSENSSEYLSTDAQSETSSDMVVEKVLNTEWLPRKSRRSQWFSRWLSMAADAQPETNVEKTLPEVLSKNGLSPGGAQGHSTGKGNHEDKNKGKGKGKDSGKNNGKADGKGKKAK